jgi:hypothetical protein
MPARPGRIRTLLVPGARTEEALVPVVLVVAVAGPDLVAEEAALPMVAWRRHQSEELNRIAVAVAVVVLRATVPVEVVVTIAAGLPFVRCDGQRG